MLAPPSYQKFISYITGISPRSTTNRLWLILLRLAYCPRVASSVRDRQLRLIKAYSKLDSDDSA